MIKQYFGSVAAGATEIIADVTGSKVTIEAGDNIAVSANAATATVTVSVNGVMGDELPVTQDNDTNATNYVVFNAATSGFLAPKVDSGLYYNPATGILTVTGIRFGDETIASTASEAFAVANFSFNIAGDDSTQRIISLDETVKFIGAGGISTASDAEGNITITATSAPTITGGTINNAVIGGTTPAAGSFTTLIGGSGSANYVQLTGAATANDPTISVQGTDGTRGLRIQSKGTSFLYLQNNLGTTQFSAGGTSVAVNYLNARGNAAGNGACLETSGSDPNIAMQLRTTGTGAIDLAAGSSGINISNGNTITAITGVTGGSYTTIPIVTISLPTTSGGVQATATAAMQLTSGASVAAAGTGYNVGDVITLTGGTFSAASQLTVATLTGGPGTGVATFTVTTAGSYTVLPASPISTTVSPAGGTGFEVTGLWTVRSGSYTITNAGSGYVEQPTVSFSSGTATAYATVGAGSVIRAIGATGNSALDFQVPSSVVSNAGAPVLRLRDVSTSSSAGFIMIQNNNGYTQLVAQGPTDAALNIASNGAGRINFNTQSTGEITQFRVTNTTAAVNFSQVTGATQGTGPTLSVGGTDAINDLNIQPAGAGRINIRSDLSVRNVYAQGGNNLALWSQDITQATWGKASGTTVGTGITAPDGNATANSLTSSTIDGYIFQSPISATTQPFGTFTMSVWLKVPSGTLNFNIYLIDGGGAGFLTQQLCALTTSWQRFSITRTTSAYITTGLQAQIGGGSSFGVGRVIHIWGVQIEPGPGVSYYLPTTSSTITSANTVTASSFRYTNGEVPGYTYQLDDISNRFNGSTVSFPLTYNDGTAIAPNNPNKINITVGNVPVKPARYIRDFFNLPEFAVFTQGYVISGSTITFATPPLRGMNFYGEVRTNQDLAPTFTFKQAPFSALNIMSRS